MSAGHPVAEWARAESGEDMAGGVKNMASQAREKLMSTAENQKRAGADYVVGVADAVRRAAGEFDEQIPQAGEYIRSAADQMQTMADSLRRRDVGQMLSDVQSFARRQPTAFLGVSFLAGFAAIRFLRSSSRDGSGTAGQWQRQEAMDDGRYGSSSAARMSALRCPARIRIVRSAMASIYDDEQTGQRPLADKNVAELVSEALQQFSRLVRSEVGLLRAEASEKARQALRSGAMLGIAGVVAIPSLAILMLALVAFLVEMGLAASLSCLITAVVGFAIAGVLAKMGLSRLRADLLVPNRTINQLQRDAATMKEHL